MLNTNLLDVLIRFRYHKIGQVSDIEKAFLQISMRESDRDVRFLWIDSISCFVWRPFLLGGFLWIDSIKKETQKLSWMLEDLS